MTNSSPTSTDNEKILMSLIRARNEDEVEKILQDQFFDKVTWKPLGGDNNNYSIVSAQQSNPINALCEKPINSIDAVLLKQCKLKDGDPAGPNAPKTMKDAVQKYFDIPDGNFGNLTKEELRHITDQNNVRIIADGSKESPNIIIADSGEGQKPDDFENTLLSLAKGNKKKIKFVQGKYNMGGTGVLPFCGDKGYQLILARKSTQLDGEDSEWGFTLVREKPDVSSEYKTTWYEYFTDCNGKIFRISGKPLKILPKNEKMEDGCFIKLYNYDIPHTSVITAKLWQDLNTRLHSPAIPISMVETRSGFDHLSISSKGGKSNWEFRILYGNKYRIQKDFKNHVYKNFSIHSRLKSFGTNKIDVTVLKHASMERKKRNTILDFRQEGDTVLLTQNGQTHHSISQAIFKTKTNLTSIASYIIVHIDLTNIPPTKSKMFMGNREYVRRNTDYKELIKRIFHDISDDNQLKSINNEYTKLDDENSVKDSSMESLISKIIRKNDSIMDLLDGGDISAESDTKEEQKSEFTGKYIPTFLKVRGTQECITHEKQIPSNKQWTYIQFKTDASNDYTTRESDRGELIVEWNKDILNGTYYDPYDGIIRVKLGGEGIEGDKIGDLKVALTRPNTEPLECTINLYFGKPKQGPKKRPPVSKDTGISIPKYTWIRRDQWDQFGWDEDTVAVADLENIRINRNNRTLEEFKRNRPSEDGNKITSKFGIHIYFTSLMLYLEMKDDPEYEKIFGKAISAASKICLPIAYDFDDDAIQKFSRLEQVISK